jgi:hypothetical protein
MTAAGDLTRPEGRSSQFFSVVAFNVAGLEMPYLQVTRRNAIALAFGGPPEVQLESIDFDQRFAVKAKGRRSAVMLLDPGMMQLLLDCESVSFQMSGDKVLAFVNRATEPKHQPAEPLEFEMLFRFWDGFVTAMPSLLRSEYGAS